MLGLLEKQRKERENERERRGFSEGSRRMIDIFRAGDHSYIIGFSFLQITKKPLNILIFTPRSLNKFHIISKFYSLTYNSNQLGNYSKLTGKSGKTHFQCVAHYQSPRVSNRNRYWTRLGKLTIPEGQDWTRQDYSRYMT